jgi:hypothetical protein
VPPLKQQKKAAVKDSRSSEEIAVHSAITSHYNTLIPGFKAEHIRIKNPLTGKDPLFNVNDPQFFELFYELSELGLKDKMMNEVQQFAETIDPAWNSVHAALQGYFKAKEVSDDSPQDAG